LFLQPDKFFLDENINRPGAKPGFIADYIIEHKLDLCRESIFEAASEVEYFVDKMNDEIADVTIERIKEYVEYVREHEVSSDPQPVYLSDYNRYRCKGCVENLRKHEKVIRVMQGDKQYNEMTILSDMKVKVEDKETILKFKGKLDNLTVDEFNNCITINDLKTTYDVDKFMINSEYASFNRYHYARQLGLYVSLLKPQFKDYNIKVNIITIETRQPKFNVRVYPITSQQIRDGIKEASSLINRVAFHECFGYDEIYPDEV